MTDIVERLREFSTEPLCSDAADEIERLRAALADRSTCRCRRWWRRLRRSARDTCEECQEMERQRGW